MRRGVGYTLPHRQNLPVSGQAQASRTSRNSRSPYAQKQGQSADQGHVQAHSQAQNGTQNLRQAQRRDAVATATRGDSQRRSEQLSESRRLRPAVSKSLPALKTAGARIASHGPQAPQVRQTRQGEASGRTAPRGRIGGEGSIEELYGHRRKDSVPPAARAECLAASASQPGVPLPPTAAAGRRRAMRNASSLPALPASYSKSSLPSLEEIDRLPTPAITSRVQWVPGASDAHAGLCEPIGTGTPSQASPALLELKSVQRFRPHPLELVDSPKLKPPDITSPVTGKHATDTGLVRKPTVSLQQLFDADLPSAYSVRSLSRNGDRRRCLRDSLSASQHASALERLGTSRSSWQGDDWLMQEKAARPAEMMAPEHAVSPEPGLRSNSCLSPDADSEAETSASTHEFSGAWAASLLMQPSEKESGDPWKPVRDRGALKDKTNDDQQQRRSAWSWCETPHEHHLSRKGDAADRVKIGLLTEASSEAVPPSSGSYRSVGSSDQTDVPADASLQSHSLRPTTSDMVVEAVSDDEQEVFVESHPVTPCSATVGHGDEAVSAMSSPFESETRSHSSEVGSDVPHDELRLRGSFESALEHASTVSSVNPYPNRANSPRLNDVAAELPMELDDVCIPNDGMPMTAQGVDQSHGHEVANTAESFETAVGQSLSATPGKSWANDKHEDTNFASRLQTVVGHALSDLDDMSRMGESGAEVHGYEAACPGKPAATDGDACPFQRDMPGAAGTIARSSSHIVTVDARLPTSEMSSMTDQEKQAWQSALVSVRQLSAAIERAAVALEQLIASAPEEHSELQASRRKALSYLRELLSTNAVALAALQQPPSHTAWIRCREILRNTRESWTHFRQVLKDLASGVASSSQINQVRSQPLKEKGSLQPAATFDADGSAVRVDTRLGMAVCEEVDEALSHLIELTGQEEFQHSSTSPRAEASAVVSAVTMSVSNSTDTHALPAADRVSPAVQASTVANSVVISLSKSADAHALSAADNRLPAVQASEGSFNKKALDGSTLPELATFQESNNEFPPAASVSDFKSPTGTLAGDSRPGNAALGLRRQVVALDDPLDPDLLTPMELEAWHAALAHLRQLSSAMRRASSAAERLISDDTSSSHMNSLRSSALECLREMLASSNRAEAALQQPPSRTAWESCRTVLRDTRTTWARCRVVLRDLASSAAAAKCIDTNTRQHQQELEKFFTDMGITSESQEEVDALIGNLSLLARSPKFANAGTSSCRSPMFKNMCHTPPMRSRQPPSSPCFRGMRSGEKGSRLRPQRSPRASHSSQQLVCADRSKGRVQQSGHLFASWNARPSVATWYQSGLYGSPWHGLLATLVTGQAPGSALSASSSWFQQPSVGSWLRNPMPWPALRFALQDTERPGGHQMLALFLAARDGDSDAVARLIAARADPCAVDEQGISALHLAAGSSGPGAEDVVVQLLARGASPNSATHGVDSQMRGVTPLHVAAYLGATSIARQLLRAGAAANAARHDGVTPLHFAAQGGHEGVVCELLRADAAPVAIGAEGFTPLHDAAHAGHSHIVATLLHARASPSCTDKTGATPLHSTAQRGDAETTKLLLQAGAVACAASDDGFTPLHDASAGGHLQVVRLLLDSQAAADKAGSLVELFSNGGASALHLAAQAGHDQVALALVKAGACPNTPGQRGILSPLRLAARRGHAHVVRAIRAAERRTRSLSNKTPSPVRERARSHDNQPLRRGRQLSRGLNAKQH